MNKGINKFTRKVFGNYYRFLAYLYNQYQLHEKGLYKSNDFAFFGTGAAVDPGVIISSPANVVIGEYSIIHRGSYINSRGGLYIGRYSGIGYNCQIYTVDHKIFHVNAIPFDNEQFLKPVHIDDFVMMGANVCITPGVRVGEGSIIGMGAVLSKDIPPLSIVFGNPAQQIGYRDKVSFDKLKDSKMFQSQHVDKYNSSIPLYIKRKYKDILSHLNLDID